MTIDHFEHEIDEVILKRGLSYFKKGYVSELTEISNGTYQAFVEGSEVYEVHLKLKQDLITEHRCSCPYDLGPVCKHVAAVLFQLVYEKNEPQNSYHERAKKKSIKKTLKETVDVQINQLLEKISDEAIRSFILEYSLENKEFRTALTIRFAEDNGTVSYYRKIIKAILTSAGKSRGFIERNRVGVVGLKVHQLMQQARLTVDNGNTLSGMQACVAVLEEMTKALQFADDSNGDIGGNIDDAMSLLYEIAGNRDLKESMRKSLWDYCLEAYSKKIFEDWDWHFGMLELAAVIIKDKHEAEIVLNILKNIKGRDYLTQNAQLLQIAILNKTGDVKAAQRMMEANLNNPGIREMTIQKLIGEKNFTKAKKIADEGMELNKKTSPGYQSTWMKYLLQIANTLKQKDEIISCARWFILEGKNVHACLALVKENLSTADYRQFIEALLSHLYKKSEWNKETVISIYIFEQCWPELLDILKSSPWLQEIEQYESYLKKDFSTELAILYATAIQNELEQQASRNKYKFIIRYIRRIQKLGATLIAQNLITQLREKYNNRPALLEELGRV